MAIETAPHASATTVFHERLKAAYTKEEHERQETNAAAVTTGGLALGSLGAHTIADNLKTGVTDQLIIQTAPEKAALTQTLIDQATEANLSAEKQTIIDLYGKKIEEIKDNPGALSKIIGLTEERDKLINNMELDPTVVEGIDKYATETAAKEFSPEKLREKNPGEFIPSEVMASVGDILGIGAVVGLVVTGFTLLRRVMAGINIKNKEAKMGIA